MSYQNLSRELDLVAAPFLARLVGVYTLTAADVASTGNYPGMTTGTNLYSFVEQTYNPTTGLPQDANPGRQTMNGTGRVGSQSMPVAAAPKSAWATEDNNSLLAISNTTPPAYTNPGVYVEMRLTGSVRGHPQFEFQALNALAWVEATTATPSEVFLGRTVTDAVLNGTTTITSATANFTSGDVGATLIGAGIPGSTTISSVTNSTTAVANHSMTAGTGVTVQIVTGNIKAYAATIATESTISGTWSTSGTVWLQQANDSVWGVSTGVPVVSGQIYQCRYFGTDDSNVPIWTVAEHPPASLQIGQGTTTAVSALSAGAWATYSSLSVTLPSAGTYLLSMAVSVQVSKPNAGTAGVEAQLIDTTNAVTIGPAVMCAGCSNTPASGLVTYGTGAITYPYVAPGSVNIQFRTYFSDGGGGGSAAIIGNSGFSGLGGPSITFLKVG